MRQALSRRVRQGGARLSIPRPRRCAAGAGARGFVYRGRMDEAVDPLRILRGLDGLDHEEFEDLVHSIALSADHRDDELA